MLTLTLLVLGSAVVSVVMVRGVVGLGGADIYVRSGSWGMGERRERERVAG